MFVVVDVVIFLYNVCMLSGVCVCVCVCVGVCQDLFSMRSASSGRMFTRVLLTTSLVTVSQL